MRLELLDLVAQSGWIAGGVTIVVIVFVCALLFTRLADSTLFGWAIAMLIGALLRVMLSVAWLRGPQRRAEREFAHGGTLRIDEKRLSRWERLHAIVAFVSGFTWCSLVIILQAGSERGAILAGLVFLIALVLGNSSLVANRAAYLLFALPIIVTQAINLLRLSADHRLPLAAAWLVIGAALYFLHRASSNMLLGNLEARIDHERRAVEQRALLDNAPLGIIVVREGRIVVCNDALLKLFGYAHRDDLLGKSVRMLIPDDAAWQEALKDGAEAMRGPVPAHVVRRRRADGSLIEVKLDIAAVEPGNRETEFVGIYENIDERTAIEESFRHVVQLQRLVFESAGEGIAIVSAGVIEQANQALADLVGIPTAQLKDRPFSSIFEDPKGWSDIEDRFERHGSTLKVERRILRSDGRATWAGITGRAVDAPQSGETSASRSIWIVADLSMQKQREAETWHQANHDVLTGLPNRRFLQDRLDQAVALARRDGRRVAILALDLDGFKSVNDTHGHRFGDAVLEEVARRLSGVVRELDTVGRWGGDEFVLVLKEIESSEVVEDMVKRVIARVAEPVVYRAQQLSVGVSVGIALYPDHGEEVETVILAADMAMYEAKAVGGNTWRFSSSPAQAARGKYRPALERESANS